jgi:branched-chain amino acid transport system substrate-binding protein
MISTTAKPTYDMYKGYMRIKSVILSFAIAISIATLFPFFYSEAESKPKLGVILPLTGKATIAGEAVRNGATMANDILGAPFELVFEDNGLDNGKTISAARKLLKTEGVLGIIVYASGPSNVASPIAEAAEIPMIGMSVDLNVSRNKNWVMIHWASNKNVADMLFEELERRSVKSIAILTSQVQGTIDLEEYFLSVASKKGIEVVFKKQLLPTEIDFQTPITVLKQKQPEAIFVNLYYGQAGLFTNQAVKMGLKPQFFSHFIFDDDNEIKNAEGSLEGAFFANTSSGDLSFDKEYKVRFGKRPVVGGIAAYDIVELFYEAFKNSDGSKSGINKFLHTVRDFNGKIGRYSALPNNSFDVPTSLRIITNGEAIQK